MKEISIKGETKKNALAKVRIFVLLCFQGRSCSHIPLFPRERPFLSFSFLLFSDYTDVNIGNSYLNKEASEVITDF